MFSLLSQWASNLRIVYERQRFAETLSKLTDLQLLDMGLERVAIEDHVRQGLPLRHRDVYRVGSPANASLQGCG